MESFLNKNKRISSLGAEPRFHRIHKFTLSLKPIFKDNSLSKFSNSKINYNEKVKELQESQESVRTSLSKHKLLNEKVKSFTSNYFDYLKVFHKHEEDSLLRNNAAIKIQKMFRYAMLKRYIDQRVVGKVRPILMKSLEDMSEHSEFCFFNIGKSLKLGTIKIQRWIRKMFFYQKIKRLQEAYLALKDERIAKFSSILKSNLRCLLCIEKIKTAAFLKNREIKLKLIRRNLAISRIKNIVKKNRINLRIMKLKIKKYRRNLFMSGLSKRRSRKFSNLSEFSENRKKSDLNIIEEDTESQNSEMKVKLEQYQANQTRTEKINLGYISYSIKRNRNKIYRTYRTHELAQLKIMETIKPISVTENTEPPKKSNKWDRVKADIFKPTKSFLMHKMQEEELSNERLIIKRSNFKYKGKVLLPTLSTKEKIRSKSEMVRKDRKWNISSHVDYDSIKSLYISERSRMLEFKARTPSPDLNLKGLKETFIREDNKFYFPSTWNYGQITD